MFRGVLPSNSMPRCSACRFRAISLRSNTMAEYVAKRDRNRCPTHPGELLLSRLDGITQAVSSWNRRSDQPLNVRRHEYPVVAPGNRWAGNTSVPFSTFISARLPSLALTASASAFGMRSAGLLPQVGEMVIACKQTPMYGKGTGGGRGSSLRSKFLAGVNCCRPIIAQLRC